MAYFVIQGNSRGKIEIIKCEIIDFSYKGRYNFIHYSSVFRAPSTRFALLPSLILPFLLLLPLDFRRGDRRWSRVLCCSGTVVTGKSCWHSCCPRVLSESWGLRQVLSLISPPSTLTLWALAMFWSALSLVILLLCVWEMSVSCCSLNERFDIEFAV